ncbi:MULTISPECIES: hypothetical protein [Ramlibacter]|uniref:Uncharacterized protein n=1 Tax=Ramlibacter pinisoli TaxID=2682844 RepID=A0A6N8ITZ3_9BURK|nr:MULTISPECIES: hypothetical protein [Ramlibacter]MBA2965400.1 hypothetical protein [Ramlibacter sp. CGMCC 1.13660]MVQ30364.1 hypothetical protein [Ramlibacter pinisoli]
MTRRSVLSVLGAGALAGCGGGSSGGGGGAGGAGAGRPTGGAALRGVQGTSLPDLLQVGSAPAYWIGDDAWNAVGLRRGTYTGPGGTEFESDYARSATLGPNGEVAWRSGWKWPIGITEVKAYPSAIFGSKPGLASDGPRPGGFNVVLPDNTVSTARPSGTTPGSFLPVTPPAGAPGAWPDMFASFDYAHLVAPSGRGQLTFDLWLQDSPVQASDFDAAPITHEIMIPLDYWGGYGAHGSRDRSWYSHDAVIDGRLWHLYFVRNLLNRGWDLVVFEPDAPLRAGTLNLGLFLQHLSTRTDPSGAPWVTGTEVLVSIELGVEPVEGIGNLQLSNYRVWRA